MCDMSMNSIQVLNLTIDRLEPKNENTLNSSNDTDLPIAITKATRNCTKSLFIF